MMRRDHHPLRALAAACAIVALGAVADAEELLDAASGAQPKVGYAVARQAGGLSVVVDVPALAGSTDGIDVAVGVACARQQVLSARQATASRRADRVRFAWTVRDATVVDRPEDWKRLRLAFDVRWPGGPAGADRRHERYLHIDGGAPSSGLSPHAADWAAIDLDDVALRIADRRDRLLVPLRQAGDGKVSVVIDDVAGHRVRNLVSGASATAAPIEWDGCDEDGQLVAPGTYRWRGIQHPGIVPEYRMNFANADAPGFEAVLSNHTHFVAAAANADVVVLAAVVTEGGFAMAAFDRDGRWTRGFNGILGAGWTDIAVALDGAHLYAAQDGEGWGMRVDRSKPDWQAEYALTVTRFDLGSGGVVDYPTGKRWSEVERHAHGPGAAQAPLRTRMSLTGMAMVDGRLYIGSRASQALIVVDAESGATLGRIPLAEPGAVTAAGGRLVALSRGVPMLVDPVAKTAKPFLAPAAAKAVAIDRLAVTALALAPDGALFLADATSSTVKRVGVDGAASTIGIPGGRYVGAWQRDRLVAPSGLALLAGKLWVAEDREAPKRAVAWDLAKGQVVREVFGNPHYGSPNAGFDPQDPSRWVGDGAAWRVDLERRTAEPRAILGVGVNDQWTTHWRWIRSGGRTWLLGSGMLNVLTVPQPDGTLRKVAAWSSCHHFCFASGWHPPDAFTAAFNAALPSVHYVSGVESSPGHGPGVLWVDRDGDGEMQAAEFSFTKPNQTLGGGAWGHDQDDLTVRLAGTQDGKPVVIALTPDGVDDNGVPRYPDLATAFAAAAPLKGAPAFDYRGVMVPSAAVGGGDLVLLSTPMTCWGADGTLRWRFPNQWADVHGSHDAPLPETGVIQGSLFVLGTAPLDATSQVFLIMGNHGRAFALTSDGIYLDELFNDVRVAQRRDAMLVGGEPFGGCFGRAADGAYWLQTGGSGFRIYRVTGLDHVHREQGELRVTQEQLLAAQRRLERRQAAEPTSCIAALPRLATPPAIDGAGSGWPPGAPQISWSKQDGRRAVAVRLGRDDANLYLHYDVADDPSPWVNNGTDWTLLFKTGDSVDLQLGSDASADPRRRTAVPGDLRLLVAPMGDQPVAVLYRYRVPGTKQGVSFSSGQRVETVDEVTRLTRARIGVRKGGADYAVDIAVPLADLGWKPVGGSTLRGDVGVIYGDEAGTIDLLRNYWSNQATGLVNDVPGEIQPSPSLWGALTVEAP